MLVSFYKFSRARIVEDLQAVLSTGVTLLEPTLSEKALEIMAEKNVDFADSLLSGIGKCS